MASGEYTFVLHPLSIIAEGQGAIQSVVCKAMVILTDGVYRAFIRVLFLMTWIQPTPH